MDLFKLCQSIQLNEEVIKNVLEIDSQYNHEELRNIWRKLYYRNTWDEGVTELREYFDEDEKGMKILTCMLNCALYTYELYEKKGISFNIFIDTIKFIPRFLERHKQIYGFYAFVWDWWFPRQLALCEFRIGELEYELKEEKNTYKVYIHIPSDANIEKENLINSYNEFKKFIYEYFSEYIDAELYCDSWLLSPSLKKLLRKDSNIIYFQNNFEIVKVEEDSNAFLEWIYFRNDIDYHNLPELTSLQREVKKYLLEGGKIGWTLGRLKGFR